MEPYRETEISQKQSQTQTDTNAPHIQTQRQTETYISPSSTFSKKEKITLGDSVRFSMLATGATRGDSLSHHHVPTWGRPESPPCLPAYHPHTLEKVSVLSLPNVWTTLESSLNTLQMDATEIQSRSWCVFVWFLLLVTVTFHFWSTKSVYCFYSTGAH